MLGQFIPQPMGYNPDANGDSFIGVDDVMGTLALYGNTFDNGDSLVIKYIDYPEVAPEYTETGWDILIQEDWDLLYLNNTLEECCVQIQIYLPEGSGFKVVQIFAKGGGGEMTIHGQASLNYGLDHAKSVTLIRGHDGVWHHPSGTNY